MTTVAIALGATSGTAARRSTSRSSGSRRIVSNLVVSDFIETEPEGEGLHDQPLYLNAVAVGETSLTPRELLDGLLAIEQTTVVSARSPTRPARSTSI